MKASVPSQFASSRIRQAVPVTRRKSILLGVLLLAVLLPPLMHAESVQRNWIDWTITIGNVLTFLGLVIPALLGYQNLNKRQGGLERGQDDLLEQQRKLQDKMLEQQNVVWMKLVNLMEKQLSFTQAQVEQLRPALAGFGKPTQKPVTEQSEQSCKEENELCHT